MILQISTTIICTMILTLKLVDEWKPNLIDEIERLQGVVVSSDLLLSLILVGLFLKFADI